MPRLHYRAVGEVQTLPGRNPGALGTCERTWNLRRRDRGRDSPRNGADASTSDTSIPPPSAAKNGKAARTKGFWWCPAPVSSYIACARCRCSCLDVPIRARQSAPSYPAHHSGWGHPDYNPTSSRPPRGRRSPAAGLRFQRHGAAHITVHNAKLLVSAETKWARSYLGTG